MSKVIEVTGLSKAYQLGEFTTGSLGEDIKRRIALLKGKEDPFLKIGETNDRASRGKSSIVWSLKDINFNIEPATYRYWQIKPRMAKSKRKRV